MRAQGRRLAATAVAVAVAVLLPVLPQTRAADPGLRTVAAPEAAQRRARRPRRLLDGPAADAAQRPDDARAGRVVPARLRRRLACAASRGRAPSPGSTPTRRGCAPTSPTRPTRRTRAAATPPSPGSATASARWRCDSRRRATRRGTSASTSTSTSTPRVTACRPRRRAGPTGGWCSAPPTTAGTSTAPAPRREAGRCATTRHRRRAPRGHQGRGVRRHRHRAPTPSSSSLAHEGERGAVLPPGRAVRAARAGQRAAALRRRPALPAGVP